MRFEHVPLSRSFKRVTSACSDRSRMAPRLLSAAAAFLAIATYYYINQFADVDVHYVDEE